MDERTGRISALLHEAGEVHHVVYRITDGADDDWASFYASWAHRSLRAFADPPRRTTRSHLVHELVECERAFADESPAPRWHDFYAARIVDRFD